MPDDPEDFKPLRFQGGRFDVRANDTVGFPLEAVAELARYERLLVQVARGLWLTANPGRQRAPKGFDESLRFRLTGVERGSVQPVLQRLPDSDTDRLFDPDQWADRSRDTIAEAIAAIVDRQPLPAAFPRLAKSSLVRFGSSLHEDEACFLPRSDAPAVRYDQQARSHLKTLISGDTVSVDGTLIGSVGLVDPNGQNFQFFDRFGTRVVGRYQDQSIFSELKDISERLEVAPVVRLDASYSTNEDGYLAAIEEVRDLETIVSPEDPLGTRFRELVELADGWRDGEGRAVEIRAVEWARDFVTEAADVEGQDLRVFPTLEGGVLVEQQRGRSRWSLEIEPGGDRFLVLISEVAPPRILQPANVAEALDEYRTFARA